MPLRAMGPGRCRGVGLAAMLATMWVWSGIAAAQTPPRTVAVIDATAGTTSDPEVTALAARLEAQLDRESDLTLVGSDRRPALIGGIPDDDADAATDVAGTLVRSRDALARFDTTAAISESDRGLARAIGLPPTPAGVGQIADLLFVRGEAELGSDPDAARRDFALVHRLDPGRALDPAKYLPEVVDAFRAASSVTATVVLGVDAPAGAEIWIDGVSAGAPPVEAHVAVGLHVLTVTGARLDSAGELDEVPAGGATVTLSASESSIPTVVHRLRRTLAAATSDAARTDTAAALVRAVGGQDAILVGRAADGALITRTYAGKTGTLGDPRPAAGRDAIDIIAPLRPIHVRLAPPIPKNPVVLPPRPWYEKRWVQVSIGGGVVAAVLGTVAAVLSQPTGTSTVTRVDWMK